MRRPWNNKKDKSTEMDILLYVDKKQSCIFAAMTAETYILEKTQLPKKGIQAVVQLLADGNTIPFITRYRKEATGSLDEVAVQTIEKHLKEFEALEKRRETVLQTIEEQGKLSEELKAKIESAMDLTTLEDLYLPYRPKRRTRAEMAREKGLEPLAKQLMTTESNPLQLASKYINKEVPTAEDAIKGAQDIIAEWVSERMDFRNHLRRVLQRSAMLESKVIGTKKNEENAQVYRDYFEWEEPLSRCPSHRFLAIYRGVNEGFLRWKLLIDDEAICKEFSQRFIKNKNAAAKTYIEEAVEDSYKRLLFPSLSNETIQNAKEKADTDAIKVFAANLKQLLLGSPLGEKRILAIDPGFRSGCKIVCLDEQGKLLHNETIYPHPPQRKTTEAIKKINTLTQMYKTEAIAIGNGTASRETEQLIRRIRFNQPVEVYVVNEAGASIYSASSIARKEFPDYDATVRGAVSIGRRLADPLAELVKIDPKSIGVGQYQHDVNQTQLQESLDQVVSNSVNAIGVNLNTASPWLLQYISGIGMGLATNIVKYREENGPFKSREELLKVPRLGQKAFEQSAGFLRIRQADNPLDNSSVHPERYGLVQRMAKDMGVSVADLVGNSSLVKKIPLDKYADDEIGMPTLKDIQKELEKPGVDIRAKAKMFTFHEDIKTIEDVKEGQKLPGIVNNITNFGCFVDIGIKESGLIHISNIADEFVKDIHEHVSLNQQVIVEVLSVDIDRKRIQLKLHKKVS